MKINETIRSRRKQLGLTQEEVASRLGVTATAVYKWEVGSCYPDITLLPALARLLGVDLNTLLCFQEDLSDEEIAAFANEVFYKMQALRQALPLPCSGCGSTPTVTGC